MGGGGGAAAYGIVFLPSVCWHGVWQCHAMGQWQGTNKHLIVCYYCNVVIGSGDQPQAIGSVDQVGSEHHDWQAWLKMPAFFCLLQFCLFRLGGLCLLFLFL